MQHINEELRKGHLGAIQSFWAELEKKSVMNITGKKYENNTVVYSNNDCQIIVATNIKTKAHVAFKVKRMDPENYDKNIYLLTELYINSVILTPHENIVKIVRMCISPTENGKAFMMEMEYMPMNLTRVIESGRMALSDIRIVCIQLLKALLHVHRRNVAHCDIKAENIMVDEHLNIKLCDFGASRILLRNARSNRYEHRPADNVCPNGREPPEIVAMQPFGTEVDMWCMGHIVLEMCHSEYFPFLSDPKQTRQSKMNIIKEICLGEIPPYYFVDSKGCINPNVANPVNVKNMGPYESFKSIGGLSSSLLSFIAGLFYANPLMRLNAVSALTHPFIFDGEQNTVGEIIYTENKIN